MYKYIQFETEGGVAAILLNRPDVLNSFNREMGSELLAAFERCSSEQSVRAILLGACGRAFCAGQDLADVQPRSDGSLPDLGEIIKECYNPLVRAIRYSDKPVVCAVNGVAAGAGANIALACDIVVASYSATFIQAFAKVGLIPDSGGTFFLPRLVGIGRAAAMAMFSEKISAEEALRLGMIYKVFTPESLLPEARRLAFHLASQPTRAFAALKKALNASFSNDLEKQLELEAELQQQCGRSSDYKEGVMAFLQKRDPQFSGR